jgi:nitrate/TMAO reductase-like tetraheme cytochrome c subunit
MSALSLTGWLAACLLLTSGLARADEHGQVAATNALPAYQQECSGCHIAYPSQMLPAASWARLMSNLPKHFGSDASLDEASTRAIANWLGSHAASGRRAQETPPDDRISRSTWFSREHDEIAAATWKRASIRSAANCAACHPGAATGRFSEHDVRIPR